MRAVADEYEPRSLDQLEQDALAILLRFEGQALSCGSIGDLLFKEATHRGSARFARIAGKVMRRLETKRCVQYVIDKSGFGGWVLMESGTVQAR